MPTTIQKTIGSVISERFDSVNLFFTRDINREKLIINGWIKGKLYNIEIYLDDEKIFNFIGTDNLRPAFESVLKDAINSYEQKVLPKPAKRLGG